MYLGTPQDIPTNGDLWNLINLLPISHLNIMSSPWLKHWITSQWILLPNRRWISCHKSKNREEHFKDTWSLLAIVMTRIFSFHVQLHLRVTKEILSIKKKKKQKFLVIFLHATVWFSILLPQLFLRSNNK